MSTLSRLSRRVRTAVLPAAMATVAGAVLAPSAGAVPTVATPAAALPATTVRTSAPASATVPGRSLLPGVRLSAGTRLVNGTSELLMQADGNLVLRAGPRVVMWWSRTAGNPGAYALLKPNNQLVVRAATGRILWASALRAGLSPKLELNDDGNMVIWTGTRPIWSTGTWVKGFAVSRLPSFGWDAAQWPCLAYLWTRESNWNPRADNPSSGAYGIPQALPASKMATEGADWLTNHRTQITWGLKYIADRYGSPCSAWNHSQQYGWYAAPPRTALPG